MKKALNLFEQFCILTMILIVCSVHVNASPQLPSDESIRPETEITEKVVYVHAISGLKLREAPGKHSRVIDVIYYGDQLSVRTERAVEDSFDQIDGWFKGGWIKVDYNGVVGYVFDAYTSSLPIPLVDIESIDCSDPVQALTTYIYDEFDIQKSLDTVLHRATDYNVRIKINQDLKHGATGVYRQYNNGYSTELIVPAVRVLDGYNLIRGLFIECDQLNEIVENAVFIKDRSTDEISEVRSDGLNIKRLPQGGISIKCSYTYQLTCCFVE